MRIYTSLWKIKMKYIYSSLLFLLIPFLAFAQFDPEYDEPEDKDTTKTEAPQQPVEEESDYEEEYRPTFLERTYIGGNLGFSFRSNFFYFDVSPLAGYDLIPQVWSVGLGATYRFQRSFGNNFDVYGGRAFSRVNISNTFFLHIEYEYLSFVPITSNSIGERRWDNNVLGGGGIWFSKSDRGGYYFSVLYALTADGGSFYNNNPWVISPGFVFYIK